MHIPHGPGYTMPSAQQTHSLKQDIAAPEPTTKKTDMSDLRELPESWDKIVQV